MDAILSAPIGSAPVPTITLRADAMNASLSPLLSNDGPTTTQSTILEPGYEAWTVAIEHPDRELLEGYLHIPHTKIAQWGLAYHYGCFPRCAHPGTTISFCGQLYTLLSVGSNSLRVLALTPEAFSRDHARYVGDTGTFQMTPVRQERLSRRRDNRQRPGRGHHCWRIIDEPLFQETTTLHASYELAVRDLPCTFRDDLPMWARGGSDEAPTSFTRRCYVQLYALDTQIGELIAWHPTTNQADDEVLPNHAKIALDTATLADAPVYRLNADEARMLAERIAHTGRPAPVTFVAPASVLPEALRTMIAPELSHVVSADASAPESEQALFQEVYYQLTGATYDDCELGRLYLASVATLVDRLSGRQTGPVQVVWLTRKQIGQSMRWDPKMKQLDTHELQVQVNTHTISRGADLPAIPSREEAATV